MMVLLQITATFIVLSSVVGQGYASDDTDTDGWVDADDNLGLWPWETYNNVSGFNDELENTNGTGDVILNPNQTLALKFRKALVNEKSRWTEGNDGFPLVPYRFLDDVDQDDVRAGISHWTDNTCLKFNHTEDRNQPHIQFFIGGGCWSFLGMQPDNGQKISIGNGCNSLGVVAHEIGHAMGFYHEQSRSDRDEYITIVSENIRAGMAHNFRKAVDNNFGVTYDYSSVMHYSGFGFSINGLNTIVVKDPLAQELIGNRGGLSHRDILVANRMYNCIDKWLTACSLVSDPCLNDGFTGKNCTCICPPGTNGTECENIVTDYYAHKRNPLSEKITSGKTIRIMAPLSGTFAKWIIPPSCKRAVLTFKQVNLFGQCWAQRFIIRTDPTDISGQSMCHSNVDVGTRIESEWEIILTMYNRVKYHSAKLIWEAEVTFEEISGCGSSTTPHSTSEMTTPEPTSSPGTCPVCPTTPVPITCPTTPATCPPTTMSTSCPITTCPPVPTIPITTTPTPPPSKRIQCIHKGEEHTIRIGKGHAVTIISPRFPSHYPKERFTCGWKLKAKRRGRLTATCDYFRIHHRDKLEIESEKGIFRSDQRPYFDINQLVIKFKSRKASRGRGFRCTVVSE